MENLKKSLIRKAIEIINEYDKCINENGEKLNIFTALNCERDEVFTHSKMIYTLLNNRYAVGNKYLLLFLKQIGIQDKLLEEYWHVEREWVFNNGRIDFYVFCEDFNIAVEMKIDAQDGEKQLLRYEQYLKKRHKGYKVFYLTLDGKSPSKQSIEGVDVKKFSCISFKHHILEWLKECLAITSAEIPLYSFIQQYMFLINKLTGEDTMKEKMNKIISNSKELEAAIEIADSLKDIKSEVLVNFWDCLYKYCIKYKNKPFEIIREDAVNFYEGGYAPEMLFLIKEFTLKGNKKVKFCMSVEIDYNLYYYFGIFEERDDGYNYLLNREEFRNKHKRVYDECNNALIEAFGSIKRKASGSLLWEYIEDTDGNRYDFKHFSKNCIMLKDNYEEEADRIAKIVCGLKMSVVNVIS